MSRSKSKKRLDAIRKLVDNLSDRDLEAKRDMRLFEEFFLNFPIPVTIWAVTKEGSVMSQRGNGIICENASCIETLFTDENQKDFCLDAHKSALSGKPAQDLVDCGEKMFYMSVAPRRDEEGNVSGAAGLAWDVTPNYHIMRALEEIESIAESVDDDHEGDSSVRSILKLAKDALNNSRLSKIIDSKKEG